MDLPQPLLSLLELLPNSEVNEYVNGRPIHWRQIPGTKIIQTFSVINPLRFGQKIISCRILSDTLGTVLLLLRSLSAKESKIIRSVEFRLALLR